MLELKGIKKNYPAGDTIVHALKGIDLKFRRCELVSILGPSGCGKTTMLNIIGGLDQYTEGDLIINGKSTKDFKDRDWDTYRNHSIGFVFQSYNLIPHQTVLQNVEIALTLSGVSKTERRKRAIQALKDVGLESQLTKKPSEMSGGQMQRVAIARALVNNPEIILADEPTGALDTETSVQVMDILKEISKTRLVIMVTHNPELAEKYSSRIIKMLDGSLLDDTAPLTPKECQLEEINDQTKRDCTGKVKMPSMSFGTSFLLSLKNLFTKKGRTMLTSFAGSIGIIGIALVLSISQGFTNYIDIVQEETLSSYPLTINETETDLTTLMETFMGTAHSNEKHENDAVYKKSAVYEMMNALNNMETTENDLKSFKEFIEKERADEGSSTGLHDALSGIQYSYNFDMLVYTKNIEGNIIKSDTEELLHNMIMEYMGVDMSAMTGNQTSMFGMDMSSMMSFGHSNLWQEMLPGDNGQTVSDVIKNQYDVVYGEWPDDYNEIVLVLDKNNELDDMTLYALGLVPKENIENIMAAAFEGRELENSGQKKWSYEDICGMEFKSILNSDCYSYDENTGLYADLRESDAGLQYLYDNGVPLRVTGIIKPNEDATASMLNGSIAYTSKLTEYVIEHSKESKAISAQLADSSADIFTGLPFKDENGSVSDSEKSKFLTNYLSGLDETAKAEAYVKIMSVPTGDTVAESVNQAIGSMSRADMENMLIQSMSQQMGMNQDEITAYIQNMSDDEITETVSQIVEKQAEMQYAQQVQEQLSGISPAELSSALDKMLAGLTEEQAAFYYDKTMEFSDSDYEENLSKLGYVNLDEPSAINLYASTFENKDVIEDAIKDYNSQRDEMSQLKYTDYVGLMMSSVTTIINTIAYVLIAFVAISLIVSSIMIGVITLISVQERTKEIGILRSIGASKRDVSGMFNAETLIIGFTSGLLGILVTYLICIPVNILVHAITGINNLSAYLPPVAALILIAISMILTLIAGIIPSKSAAKKDPVVALRSE